MRRVRWALAAVAMLVPLHPAHVDAAAPPASIELSWYADPARVAAALTAAGARPVEPARAVHYPDPLRREIALTFDDGPSPAGTQAIVDLLVEHGASATFFVVGSSARRHPQIVRRTLGAGMAVGNHTWRHTALDGVTPELARDELGRTKDQLTRLGAKAGVWRPPYGRFDAAAAEVARSLGLRAVRWNLDPEDWAQPGADTIVTRVLSQVRPGSVVLLHDGGGDRTQTVDALRVLLPELIARGYRFTTLA